MLPRENTKPPSEGAIKACNQLVGGSIPSRGSGSSVEKRRLVVQRGTARHQRAADGPYMRVAGERMSAHVLLMVGR
jgi:hypothetical protein